MKLNQPCVGTSAAPSSDVLGQPRNKDMRRAIAVLLTILVMADLGLAEETTFTGVKLADAKGKQADAHLLFMLRPVTAAAHHTDFDRSFRPFDLVVAGFVGATVRDRRVIPDCT